MEVSSQLHVPAALAWYPLNKRLDRPQSRSERFWKSGKTSLLSCNRTNPIARSLVTVPTVLTWLQNVHLKPRCLTFKDLRPIYRTGVPLPSKCCILYIFSTNMSTVYFKHAAHSPFFSSKCRLFHNATFFGSCIIHILHTGVLKFKCKI